MEFGVPAPQSRFKVFELCPKCWARLEITDKRVILNNREIECSHCGNKWKLNINEEKK